MRDLSVVLAALYLRGAPRPAELRRSAWPDLVRILRRSACKPQHAAEALRDAGCWAEALVLESPDILDWASRNCDDERVLSAVDAAYPCRWLRVLGHAAPPVLWRNGETPALPMLSIVGSRVVPSAVGRFCNQVAREVVSLGFCVVSGRAEGCDRAAAGGARSAGGHVVEILPHGIDRIRSASSGCLLSLCPPDEPFSSAAAMERNALIYAASSHTVIGKARFKEGGTWHGAVHAVRSRLSTLLVRRSDDVAMRSLVGIGGEWLDSPSDLGAVLKARTGQSELFEGSG